MFNSCRMSSRMLPSELASDREPGLILKCIETRGMEHAKLRTEIATDDTQLKAAWLVGQLTAKTFQYVPILRTSCDSYAMSYPGLRSTHFWLGSGLRPPACPISGRSPLARPRWDCSSRATPSQPGPVTDGHRLAMGRWVILLDWSMKGHQHQGFWSPWTQIPLASRYKRAARKPMSNFQKPELEHIAEICWARIMLLGIKCLKESQRIGKQTCFSRKCSRLCQ